MRSYLADGLADNGGPTRTIALLHNPRPPTPEANPALAAIPDSFMLPVAVHSVSEACLIPDQRGVLPDPRIACDVGCSPPPVMPWSPRAMMRRLRLGARPHNSDVRLKPMIQPRK